MPDTGACLLRASELVRLHYPAQYKLSLARSFHNSGEMLANNLGVFRMQRFAIGSEPLAHVLKDFLCQSPTHVLLKVRINSIVDLAQLAGLGFALNKAVVGFPTILNALDQLSLLRSDGWQMVNAFAGQRTRAATALSPDLGDHLCGTVFANWTNMRLSEHDLRYWGGAQKLKGTRTSLVVSL